MNISTNTYDNYQSGFSYPSVPHSKTLNIKPLAENNQTFNTVSNSNNSTQKTINQTSETNSPKQEHTGLRSQETEETQTIAKPKTISGEEQTLTRAEIQLVEELKQTDIEVRQHEMAHIAAGGRYITSGANLTYKRGPDGKEYAVAGEVSIDTSPVPGDPRATIRKMRQIKNAALAPANPSSQDLKVASNATSTASKALSELVTLQAKEQAIANENKAFGSLKKAAQSYEKISRLPEEQRSTFQTAV
ncbi:putative metalloprotease CJM1_0395 family protein [Desulfobacula phenolica]|uniref:SprA-related family protein n=1 Tax=Desulfobacula phenolica TaxID=90732 RepID=A0A1H2EMJ8_9BACT|nr:putative metalloprotease CJM1_0395 family protein [Desulfobacula phenolica]SDT96173.1 SprA-related family protein [Desulfobacula phenolica]